MRVIPAGKPWGALMILNPSRPVQEDEMSKRRHPHAIETMELKEAAGILGVAQKAIEQADALAQRGSRTMGRALSRQRIREAREAADEAQRAINAELS